MISFISISTTSSRRPPNTARPHSLNFIATQVLDTSTEWNSSRNTKLRGGKAGSPTRFRRVRSAATKFAETVSPYDQTHILTAVGDIDFGKNWKFSGRVRYVTGNPYTPDIGGVFDADADTYTPVSGGVYSQRMGSFFEADIRFDKKWIYDTWILTGYLDVENVTNRQNPQQINYSYNYSQTAVVTGLPILPTVGIKGEF